MNKDIENTKIDIKEIADIKNENIEVKTNNCSEKIIIDKNNEKLNVEIELQKSQKGIGRITIFIMAFIIGLLIIVQLNTAEKVTGGLSTSQKSLQLQKTLKNIREERAIKDKELEELEVRLNEIMAGVGEEAVGVQLQKEIEKYDKIIGYTEALGPGIILTLTDKNEGHLLENNYELILSVINKLNAAGAEGISLNLNRWATDSYLNLSNGMLYINETPISAPFVITAIGDPNTLEASLNLRFGILYELKNNYEIEGIIEKSESIVLPKLNRTIDLEYGKVEDK